MRIPKGLTSIGFQFLLSLVAASLVLLIVEPLGPGPVWLTPAAYTVEAGTVALQGSGEAAPAQNPFILRPTKDQNSRVSYLFHDSLELRLVLEMALPTDAASQRVQLRLNNKRLDALQLLAGKPEARDIRIARGDRLTVVVPLNRADGAGWTELKVGLANEIGFARQVFVALLWGILLVVMLRLRRPFLWLLFVIAMSIVMVGETLNFGPMTLASLSSYLALTFSCFFLIAYITAGPRTPAAVASLIAVGSVLSILSIPVVYAFYSSSFDKPMDEDILYAIFQTHFSEALEYVFSQFGSVTIPLFLVGAFVVFSMSYLEIRLLRPSPPAGLATLCCSLLLLLAVLDHQRLRMVSHFLAKHREYSSEVAAFERTLWLRERSGLQYAAEKSETGEVYAVVIGESQSRNNMGLYGYLRPTNPELSQFARDELLAFRKAFSSHTHTMPTLSLALTSANQLNGADFYASPSLLDVARAAGFDTAWISNQAMYGPWDNIVSALAARADTTHRLNSRLGRSTRSDLFDEAVLPLLERLLDQNGTDNKFVVIHLMGSHGSYCDRYPVEFSEYKGPLTSLAFGTLAGQFDAILNCYDNSILYNDFVVAEIVKVLKQAGRPAALVYFADHAEDVLGGRRHASSRFTYPMTEIPMLIWLSADYRERYPDKDLALRNHLDDLFSNDFIYDTVVGVAGISTEHYEASRDLSSGRYLLEEGSAVTLEGKRRWAEAGNVGYYQRENLQRLVGLDLATRLIPHRVNTLGKLAQVRWDGARGAEIDVMFDENSGTFQVGHDPAALTDGTLDQLLRSPPADGLRKIWLDVKNLSRSNAAALRQRILDLDRSYSLKGRAIIETSSTEADFSALAAEGFHTSYYLPTKRISKAIELGDEAGLAKAAAEIAARVGSGSYSAVSFDARIYPFVSRYLTDRLRQSVVYHTWDLSMKLGRERFFEQMQEKEYYGDERVSTILVPYKSVFTL